MPASCYVKGCENNRGWNKTRKIALKKKGVSALDPLKNEQESKHDDGQPPVASVRKRIWNGLKFPRRGPENLRQAWLKNIPQIPGLPFDFKKHRLCNLHFDAEDIIREDLLTIQGNVITLPRRNPRLRPSAVPFKFPGSVVKNRVQVKSWMEEKTEEIQLSIQTYGQRLRENRTLNDKKPTDPLSPISYSEEEEKPVDRFDLKKTYYCAFCLKNWMSGVVSTTHLQKKADVFKKFLRFLGRHANAAIDVKIRQFVESFAKELDSPELKIRSSCYESLTTCASCFKEMSKLCEAMDKLELLKMKTTAEVLKFIELLERNKEDEEEAREQEKRFSAVLGIQTLQGIKSCRDNVRKAAQQLLVPRVALKILNPCDVNIVETNPPPSEETPTTEHTNLFTGNSKIRQLVGVVRPSQILTCHSCGKTCQSRNELEDHRQVYHSLNVFQVVNTATLSDSEEVEEEVDNGHDGDSSYYPSTPGADDFSEIEDDGMMDIEDHQETLNNHTDDELEKKGMNENSIDCTNHDKECTVTCDGPPLPPPARRDESCAQARVEDVLPVVPILFLNNSLFTSKDPCGFGEHFENVNNCYDQVRKTMGPDPGIQSKTIFSIPKDQSTAPAPANQQLMEPKPEMESEEIPKKVPLMSADHIGKHKVLCKLKNLQTGKTVLGVVAKPGQGNLSSPNLQLPRVISVKSDHTTTKKKAKKKKKLPPPPSFPGPPFTCPLEGCSLYFLELKQCKEHYRRHKRKIKKMHDDIANGVVKSRKRKLGTSRKDNESFAAKGEKLERLRHDDAYQCQVENCGFGCKHQQHLDYHMKFYHTEFQCHFCNEKISNLRKLFDHEVEHVSSSKVSISSSSDRSDATDLLTEKGFTCPRCGFISNQSDVRVGLMQHYSVVHFQLRRLWRDFTRKALNCSDCNRGFENTQKYIRHVQNFHGKTVELPFQCPDCDKRFLSKLALKSHKMRHHSNKIVRRQVLTCNICSSVYTKRTHYDNHMKRHYSLEIDQDGKRLTKRNPNNWAFSCDKCEKRFFNEGYLWNHKMEFHSHDNSTGFTKQNTAELICSICGKMFQKNASLAVHMRVHSSTRTPATADKVSAEQVGNGVICDLCGKKFVNLGRLKMHVRMVHDKEPQQGPTVCEFCGKTYPSKWNLFYHKKRMHPVDEDGNPVEKPLPVCQICGNRYPNMGLLRKHINTKHELHQPT